MSFTRPQAVLALFAASISICACRQRITPQPSPQPGKSSLPWGTAAWSTGNSILGKKDTASFYAESTAYAKLGTTVNGKTHVKATLSSPGPFIARQMVGSFNYHVASDGPCAPNLAEDRGGATTFLVTSPITGDVLAHFNVAVPRGNTVSLPWNVTFPRGMDISQGFDVEIFDDGCGVSNARIAGIFVK